MSLATEGILQLFLYLFERRMKVKKLVFSLKNSFDFGGIKIKKTNTVS
jgi:hypothetical protein